MPPASGAICKTVIKPFVSATALLLLFTVTALPQSAAQSQERQYPIPRLEVSEPNTWGRAIFRASWTDPNTLKPVNCRHPVGRCANHLHISLASAALALSHLLHRYGHTMLLRSVDSSLYMFGGLDGRGQFLNDLWKFKLDPGPYECDWQELFPAQSMADQYLSRDTHPLTTRRRGQVPGQPSGRAGHSATLSNVTMEDGRIREVMTILGGYGPNCSDYCRDFWHYDFRDARWVVQYVEYWSKFGDWAATVNYSRSLEKLPEKRWRHSAMTHGNRLYLYGGHGESYSRSPRPCCGHNCGVDSLGQPRPATAEAGCGYVTCPSHGDKL